MDVDPAKKKGKTSQRKRYKDMINTSDSCCIGVEFKRVVFLSIFIFLCFIQIYVSVCVCVNLCSMPLYCIALHCMHFLSMLI